MNIYQDHDLCNCPILSTDPTLDPETRVLHGRSKLCTTNTRRKKSKNKNQRQKFVRYTKEKKKNLKVYNTNVDDI